MRKSTGVHDPIYRRVLALESSGMEFILVASDLAQFSPAVYEEVAEELERTIRIPRTHFWWSVTHTHAAPEVGAPGIYETLPGRSDHDWDREHAACVKPVLARGSIPKNPKNCGRFRSGALQGR